MSVGSRVRSEEMNRIIEANGIEPVVDERLFEMAHLKEAHQYMWTRRNFGKVAVNVA